MLQHDGSTVHPSIQSSCSSHSRKPGWSREWENFTGKFNVLQGCKFLWKIILSHFKILFLSGCMSVINIVVDPMSVNLNYVKLEIKFINLTCIIELKINICCNNTPLWVIVPRLMNERVPESILKDRYRLGITVNCIL